MIKFNISNIGNILSLKNNKMLARGRMLTTPRAFKQQKEILSCLESQLHSLMGIKELMTWMGVSELSSIVLKDLPDASLMLLKKSIENWIEEIPKDDNYLIVSELKSKGIYKKDKPSVIIEIEKI